MTQDFMTDEFWAKEQEAQWAREDEAMLAWCERAVKDGFHKTIAEAKEDYLASK